MHPESEVPCSPQALSLPSKSPWPLTACDLGLNELSASFWGSGGKAICLSFYSVFQPALSQE